ncbi:pyruvate formate lyase family protein, partial [Serratia sp. ME43]|uniref:pyruvate formate lyase family protein n=1 Tax=Serratia sp. ME43 TaxID=2744256 RepID=UPI0015F6300F
SAFRCPDISFYVTRWAFRPFGLAPAGSAPLRGRPCCSKAPDNSVSFGRLDQYLYPWYRRDVELEQNLARENAIELLHSCWLKL